MVLEMFARRMIGWAATASCHSLVRQAKSVSLTNSSVLRAE
jgi:hypothetical protein